MASQPICADCRQPCSKWLCDECHKHRQRLNALHANVDRPLCQADKEARALRVEMYAAIVRRGGKLFE